jgi:hypothetical protein
MSLKGHSSYTHILLIGDSTILVLEKLVSDLEHNKISISDAIVKALPMLKEKQYTDDTMSWLSNELQGYSKPLDFYYQSNHSFPEYRVVPGILKVMTKEGRLIPLDHPLTDRSKYFLSTPVSWLEDSNDMPGEFCLTEMPELAHDKTLGEVIVIQYDRKELQKTLAEIKKMLLALLK